MLQNKLVYLSLGSNIHPRDFFLSEATRLLNETIGKIIKKSSIYETESWGFSSGIPFLNSIVILKTLLNPLDVLINTQKIEKTLGRTNKGKPYSSRKIDVDILYIDDEIIELENLTVPHPLMHKRRFVLMPLVEIIPNKIHPVLNKTSKEMLKNCPDNLLVKIKNISINAL